MPPPGKHPITLVTAYFELGGKPESEKNLYPFWIRNFLPYARWPMVIFCDEQSVDMLKEARGDKPAVWHVTRPQEFYVYKYLDDLKRLSFPAGQAKVRIARSLIWHEKHHFLRQALSENPFGSEMLFWCDIGQFRHNPDMPWRLWRPVLWKLLLFRLYEDIEWPNLGVCRALPRDKVIMVRWPWYDSDDGIGVSAQFFGGAIEPSRRWCDAYYRHLEKRKQNGVFSPYEEYVMKGCWRRQPELVHMISGSFVLCFRLSQCWHFVNGWYFLNGGRLPWKYFCRRIFSGSAR